MTGTGSPESPLKSFSWEDAQAHWETGSGATVYVDMSSHMASGGGIVFSARDFATPIGNITRGLPVGTVVSFETNAALRAETGAYSAIATHNFYGSQGILSDQAYVWGNTSAGFRGTVTVLGNGQIAMSGEIRPYNEQFDFTHNTWNPMLEAARAIGAIWAGPGNAFDIRFVGSGTPVNGTYQLHQFGAFDTYNMWEALPLCFPASTSIAISHTETRPISDIRVGDTVLAFDAAADLGRGALVPRKVVRLYRNTTDEWVKLTWSEGRQQKKLIATPGHHFLDRFGNFPTIESMLENGKATVVLASGELTEVTAELIVYSAETAHLFEQAQSVGMVAGSAALKPAAIDSWQAYNFEVEDLHTYVAGGVRVHNDSGELGDSSNIATPTADTIDAARKAMEIPGVYPDAIMRQAAGYGGTYTRDSDNDSGGSHMDRAGSSYDSCVDGEGFGTIGPDGSFNLGTICVNPIVLDLDGDGVELSIGNGVAFDVDNDGYLENSTWAAADDGFLVIDLDADGSISEIGGDGIIDQAAELAFAVWVAADATDLQALAEATDVDGNLIFDSNGDGVLDASDNVWVSMKVFQDLDQDGQVDEAELRTLDDWNISQINLSYDDGSGFEETDDNITIIGNTLHGLGSFVRDGEVVEGGVGDVALSYTDPGWRRVETATGYQLEFESGVDWRFWDAEGQDAADFDLAAEDYAGAYGDLRDNKLDASGSVEAVIIDGGAGNDSIVGGAGGDLLSGGDGADTIDGGAGDDIVFADAEDDVSVGNVQGGLGYDQLVMAEDAALSVSDLSAIGFESINAGNVDDLLVGLDDETGYYLAGNGGNDTLGAAGGNDVLSGGEGDDSLSGASGADLLSGGTGNDLLDAGDGSDTLAGGAGNDTLLGGEGNDRYFYWRGDGHDLIHDIATGTYLERYEYEEQIPQDESSFKENLNELAGKEATYVNELRTGFVERSGQIDGGIDTLEFGYGIRVEDVLFSTEAGDVLIEFRNKDDAETDVDESDSLAIDDSITVLDWANQQSRIEQFVFANGVVINTSQIVSGEFGHGEANDFSGSESGDWLNSGGGNDTIVGLGGNDVLIAGEGSDSLSGGDGRDLVFAGDGDDLGDGGSGDDYIVAGAGADSFDGGAGNDVLSGDQGDDQLSGGAGNDSLLGGSGSDTLRGGAGDDVYFYFRGDGHDEIVELEAAVEADTTEEAPNVLSGAVDGADSWAWIFKALNVFRYREVAPDPQAADWDVVQFGYSIGLEDLVFELQGEDLVVGVRQVDENGDPLALELLDDVLRITDWASVGGRVEELRFADGLAIDISKFGDFQTGSASDDFMTGAGLGDLLSGGGGGDTLQGLGGDDVLVGAEGDDSLSGDAGDDDLYAGDGNDLLFGGEGRDYLLGGNGEDILDAGKGDDVLYAGQGNDTLRGGFGSDTYIFNRGDGHDTIDESFDYADLPEDTLGGGLDDFADNLQAQVAGKDSFLDGLDVWVSDIRTGDTIDALAGGDDVIQFGNWIDLADLIISTDTHEDGTNLVIELLPIVEGSEVEDSITIEHWQAPEFRVETLQFANGFLLDISKIGYAETGDSSANLLNLADVALLNGDGGWLSGGAGEDTLQGGAGGDLLMGGVDADRMEGGEGNDTYVFARGDGADSVFDIGSSLVGETSNPGGDKLLFGAGITIEDLILERDGADMKLFVADQTNINVALSELTDVVTVENWSDSANRIEVLQFYNGLDFDVSAIKNTFLGEDVSSEDQSEPVSDILNGSAAADWMDGFAGDDSINGADGNDYIFGREGADTLIGGNGNDIMSGGIGDDSLKGGSGNDIIAGGAENDVLAGGGGNDVLTGGSGDDLLDGGNGNDLIIGDIGNDTIVASAGQDQIRFGLGDGNDVYQGNADFAGSDVIVFDDGIQAENIWFERIDNDLVVRIHGADDTLKFEDWYYSTEPTAYVKGFAAGEKWLSYSQVNTLVDAMDEHIPELNDGSTAYGILPGETPDAVLTAIESAWA